MKTNTTTQAPLPPGHRIGDWEFRLQPGHCCLVCSTEVKPQDIIEVGSTVTLDCRSCGARIFEVTPAW
jgi:DNA-directed RNA polymerase subunit RPC12/RpoP